MLSLSRVRLLILLLLRVLPLCGLLLSAPALSQTLGVQLQHWRPAELDDNDASRVPRQQFQLDARLASGPRLLYRYEPIRLRQGEPAHNGHLHQFRAEMTRQWERFEVSAGLGIQGSSNRFIHQRFHEDMLVAEGVLFRTFSAPWVPDVGLAGDHRFGPFQVYPRLRWQGQLEGGWDWQLDLPVAASLQQARWRLALARVGDRWSVLDADRRLDSKVHRHEWQLSVDYQLRQPHQPGPGVTLGLGSSFDTRLRYRDLAEGRQTRRLGSTVFVRLRISGSPGW